LAKFRVTVRYGPRVSRERFDALEPALAELESRGRELQEGANAKTIDPKLTRKFQPVQQVVGRLELAGPGRLRAGVDVRGDGSAEAYTGRVRRALIEQAKHESAYDALRRALTS
jgi:hypothetical protein